MIVFFSKYKYIFIILTILFIIPTKVKAVSYESDVSNNENLTQFIENNNYIYGSLYDYTLDSYDVNIIVNENNTLKITERIGAYFNIYKHGIYRKIPLRNKVVRLDGTTSHNRAKITDITVSDKYSLSTENGYKVIKIGDPNSTLTGYKNYTISYLYNLGKDTGKNYDELYFNLIGDEWDTIISNITFSITMPKDFDEEKLGFASGKTGSTDSSNVSYTVTGNVITGIVDETLKPGEGLTVRLELPEGYFIGASNNLDLMMVLAIILPIVFLLVTLGMWYKFGKDEQVIDTVEFYPPEEFNSLEIGFLYKGKAEKNDVISLLIYLANKGYIKITEFEEKALFTKIKSFKIKKLKEYDGNNVNERLFLNGLFTAKSRVGFLDIDDYMDNYQIDSGFTTTSKVTEVTASDLYNNFYRTLNVIVANIKNVNNKHKIFEKNSLGKGLFIIFMIIAIFLLITVRPVIEYSGTESLFFALVFPVIGFSVLFGMLFGKNPIIVKIVSIIWALFFGGISWVAMVLPALQVDVIYLITYIIGIICILVMILLIRYMPKRTSYGREIFGKIRGFKNFLETAEKQRLEALVNENPTYFYDILPYTYVLGVSDKWIKKFETISLQAPGWYEGSTSFSTASFGSFMNSTMSYAQSVMSSKHSSSSGGSSGGGSSGGGSGGGGGGSW